MKIDNFISRWKLNRENFTAMQNVLGEELCGWSYAEGEQVISDFVANRIVETVKRMLDKVEAARKMEVVKLIRINLERTVETGRDGIPLATPKLLSIDRLYEDRRENIKNQSKWLIFYFLFDLDEVESTFVDKLKEV